MNRETGRKKVLWICLGLLLCVLFGGIEAYSQDATIKNRFNVMIVLDASGSMKQTDPEGLRFEAIRQFVYLLADGGNSVGHVIFSDNVVKTRIPEEIKSRDDKDSFLETLQTVSPGGDTNIGEALLLAVQFLTLQKSAETQQKPSVILFLSDGNTDLKQEAAMQASLGSKADAIQLAREEGIPIYSVCLNANDSADVREMDQISKATDGVFAEVKNASDLGDVFNLFYVLIYSTATQTLADDVYPQDGRLELPFRVPGFGVEELNIILQGKSEGISLINGNGEETAYQELGSDSFTMLKVTDIVPGEWTLISQGAAGEKIKIELIFNQNIRIEAWTSGEDQRVPAGEPIEFYARLSDGTRNADKREEYQEFQAKLHLYDQFGDEILSQPMSVTERGFSIAHTFLEGSYYYEITVNNAYIDTTTGLLGPLAAAVMEKENTPPVPVNAHTKETVYLMPFRKNSLSMDLSGLAKDAEDKGLTYRVVSSSFVEGEDYVLENTLLKMEGFSLPKGSFLIRAADSGGLFCDMEILVETRNVGLMGLIGLAVLALFGLLLLGLLTWIALNRPFNGTIQVSSQTAQGRKEGKMLRRSRRGKCRLSEFRVDNVGLQYEKSYFIASGREYILLRLQPEGYCNSQKGSEFKIAPGMEYRIQLRPEDPRYLLIKYEKESGGRRTKRGALPRPAPKR